MYRFADFVRSFISKFNTHKIQKEDLYLASMFVLLSFSFIVRSVLDENGMITMDGPHYLELAQNLKDGKGFYTTPEGLSAHLSPTGYDYFAIWPVGYSVLIWIIASIFDVSVVWAFRLSTLLMLALTLWLLRTLWGKNASVHAAILFFASPFVAFNSAWSETPFMVAMLWLVYAMQQMKEKVTSLSMLHFGMALWALFSLRYLGIFGFGVLAWMLLNKLRQKAWADGAKLVVVGAIVGSCILAYLYINMLHTGFMTGMERSGNSGFSQVEIAISFVKTLLLLCVPLVFEDLPIPIFIGMLLVQGGIFAFLGSQEFRSRRLRFDGFKFHKLELSVTVQHVFVLAIIYALVMVVLRWVQIGLFNDRMWLPAFFLLWIAFVEIGLSHAEWRQFTQKIVQYTAFASFMVYVVLWSGKQMAEFGVAGGYAHTQNQVQDEAKNVPQGSILAFGNVHLNYIRPDLVVIQPFYLKYTHQAESEADFVARMKRTFPNRALYISFNNATWNRLSVVSPYFHASWVRKFDSMPPHTVVKQ